MRAYRDRYAELFGTDVELIAISRDTPEDLASWASDEKFPFRFS
jgi:peroxiredoxin